MYDKWHSSWEQPFRLDSDLVWDTYRQYHCPRQLTRCTLPDTNLVSTIMYSLRWLHVSTPCIRSITRINDSTVIHPLLWQPTYLLIRGYDCKDMPRTEGCACRCTQRYCQGRVCNLMQIHNPFYLPLHAQAAHTSTFEKPQKYHLQIRAVKLCNSSQTWRNLWANPRGRLPDFCEHVIYVLWSPTSAGRLYLVVEHYY